DEDAGYGEQRRQGAGQPLERHVGKQQLVGDDNADGDRDPEDRGLNAEDLLVAWFDGRQPAHLDFGVVEHSSPQDFYYGGAAVASQAPCRCSVLTRRTVPELARMTMLSVVMHPPGRRCTPSSSEPSVTPVAAKMQSPLAMSSTV